MIEALQFGCTKILETPTPSGDIALIRSREAAGPLDLSGCLVFFFLFRGGGVSGARVFRSCIALLIHRRV